VNYVEVEITDGMRDRARARAQEVFCSRRELCKFGSEKKRIAEGYLGEEMVIDYLDADRVDDSESDIIDKTGSRLEVKTITAKFRPPPNYLCTVNSPREEGMRPQDADFYVFTRIRNDYKVGWILGFIRCDEFLRRATYVEKGETVAGVKMEKANAMVLPINNLLEFK
jgi:hypothetical protein